MKFRQLAAIACATALATSLAAEAKVYKSVTNIAGAAVTDVEGYHPITSSGGTSTTVKLSAKSTVAITFSAKCQNPLDTPTFIWVGIEVDGAIVKPTANRDSGFCSGGDNQYNANSMTVTKVLNAGNHTVRVKTKANVLDIFSRVYESTLLIFD